jgi:hypothetical protein
VFCRSRFCLFICSLLLSAGQYSVCSFACLTGREPFWLFICRFCLQVVDQSGHLLACLFILQARHFCFIASADLSAGQISICFIPTLVCSSILQAQHFCFIAKPSPGNSQVPGWRFASIQTC